MNTPHYTTKDIHQLVYSFDNQSLSKTQWTHQAHLIVGIFYIKNYDFFDAVCRLKSAIILINHAHNTPNTTNQGYHETLTIFWAKIIQTYQQLNPQINLENLVNPFLNTPLASKTLPFIFYDKEQLLSPLYRTFYHPETLQSINLKTIAQILNQH